MKDRQTILEELKSKGIKTALVDTILSYYKEGFEEGFKKAEDAAYKGYKVK